MAGMHVVVIQVKVFGAAIMSAEQQHPGKRGAAALSSLAHLPTYNIRDHAVYFHINKAHPFKLGCEFNLEAGLSAISHHYLWGKKYSHCNRSMLVILVIFNSCLAYFSIWVLPPQKR